MTKLILSSIVCFFVCITNVLSQSPEFKHTIRYGFSVGSYRSDNVQGTGSILSIGYMRSLKSERFRLNPYFSWGSYSAKNIDVEREQHFTSRNLGCNVYYDLLNDTGFSFFCSSGLLVNQMNGLLGNYKELAENQQQNSEYVSAYQLGGNIGLGFRIKNYDKRFYFDIMPLNLTFGRMGYLDLYATLNFNLLF